MTTTPGISASQRWNFMESEGEKVNRVIERTSNMLDQLAEAKERAVFWKTLYVAELMNQAGETEHRYGAFVMDHALAEAPFWNDTHEGSTVIIGRQS